MYSPLPNGINPADLFVSDPLAITLGQRMNDIKENLEFALVQLSLNPPEISRTHRSIEVALSHVKAAKDLLPLVKFAGAEKIANLQKE